MYEINLFDLQKFKLVSLDINPIYKSRIGGIEGMRATFCAGFDQYRTCQMPLQNTYGRFDESTAERFDVSSPDIFKLELMKV